MLFQKKKKQKQKKKFLKKEKKCIYNTSLGLTWTMGYFFHVIVSDEGRTWRAHTHKQYVITEVWLISQKHLWTRSGQGLHQIVGNTNQPALGCLLLLKQQSLPAPTLNEPLLVTVPWLMGIMI
jgi:hypothetical protein